MSAPGRSPERDGPPSRRRRRAWLAAALATGLVVALATGMSTIRRLTAQVYSGSTVYRQQISALALDLGDGDITVRPGAAGQVTVGQQLSWTAVRPTVRVERSGGTLTVVVRCGGGALLSRFGCQAEVTVLVPPGTPLTSSGDSGDLTVQRLTGPLDLSSGSGDLNLDEVSGPVQAVTGSGAVNGDGLRSGRFSARTGSGPVTVDFALPPGQVGIGTGSGPVEVDLPQGSRYRVNATSASGPRDVADGVADASADASITVDTSSGPVDIDYD